jgi:hypothetical protein
VIICGYFLWYILFHTDISVALLANKEETAIMLLDRLKESYELLPRFFKQGVEKWDQKLIKLGNKARVRAAACSASAVRGDTFNIVFLDEFAFVPANIAEEFMASVFPVISSGKTTKLFIVSTPNGFNLFYRIFTDAEKGRNSYAALQYTWRDVFYARNPEATEAEALKWRDDTIKNMANNLQKFQQEFECDFLGSANSLVAPWKLAQIDVTSCRPRRRAAAGLQEADPHDRRRSGACLHLHGGRGARTDARLIGGAGHRHHQQPVRAGGGLSGQQHQARAVGVGGGPDRTLVQRRLPVL